MPWCTVEHGRVLLDVLVVPRASKSQVVGVHDDRLKIQLNAPPVDGAANEALVELLVQMLHIKKKDVRIVSGSTGRRKRVELTNVSGEAVMALEAHGR